MATQLGVQRKQHLDKGWNEFRQGEYQKACSEFSLADGYSSGSVADRLEARVPLLYARLAVQQYTEAIGGLEWILKSYSQADAETQSRFTRSIPDLPPHYGRRSELDAHLAALGGFVALWDKAYKSALNTPGAGDDATRLAKALMEAKGLQLMVLYAVPDQRSRAVFEARSFSTMPKPWDNLGKVFVDSGLSHTMDSAGAPVRAASPAADFPFNMFQEGRPSDAAVRP